VEPDAALLAAKELIDKHTHCFAITVGENLEANARIARVREVRDDWSVRFMTNRMCRKVREIERTSKLTLAYEDDPDFAHVTLIGRPVIIGDREVIRSLWQPDSYKFHPRNTR